MKKKVVGINFHLFEKEQLCQYFHDMAKQGWMLKKLRYGWMSFEQCEPQDVFFVIDIYPHGSYLDPYEIDQNEIQYGDMVEEYGYECISRYSNYQVFKYHKDVIPIHDEESEEQRIIQHRSIIKYELMNHVLFLFLAFTTIMTVKNQLNIYTFLNDTRILMLVLEAMMSFLFFLRAVPSILWFLLKDRYHISYQHILLREYCYNSIYFPTILLLLISLMLMTQSNVNVLAIVLLPLVSIVFYYIIKIICKRYIKKHYVILSFFLTFLLTMQVSLRFIPLFISSPAPNEISTGELTRSDLVESNGLINYVDQREESSSFVSLLEYNEEYSGTTQEQGETYPITEYFGYALYTIHDTPLSSYIASLIIDPNDSKIKHIETTKQYKWYQGVHNQNYLIVGSHILVLQIEELNADDITTIIEKLHLNR